MNYICHSGGCPGADMMWETEGREYGISTIAYSFHNHVHNSLNPKILTISELREGFHAVKVAEKTLKRNVESIPYPYVKNLLSRNWFQVKNSEAVFAVGMLESPHVVKGGTGWAVQMGIDSLKPIFIFDQKSEKWYKFRYDSMKFLPTYDVPVLTENFAGIGTRKLKGCGKNAIREVLRYNYLITDVTKM